MISNRVKLRLEVKVRQRVRLRVWGWVRVRELGLASLLEFLIFVDITFHIFLLQLEPYIACATWQIGSLHRILDFAVVLLTS